MQSQQIMVIKQHLDEVRRGSNIHIKSALKRNGKLLTLAFFTTLWYSFL